MESITIGPIRLELQGQKLLAYHSALKNPVILSAKALQSWVMRQLRDQIK